MRYVFEAGGKRLRAMLVLLACNVVGGRAVSAVDAAVAVEILHNFTLVHDDVMDNALVRRGRKTVHTKWDTNVAILCGDQLIAHAYQLLENVPAPKQQAILRAFNRGFVEVCEGQALDKAFELRRRISLADYMEMIRLKTASVIESACEIGARIGGGSPSAVKSLRAFGRHLGIAFQIQDDLLDVTGDVQEFGKRIGGDIVEGKKTFLLLKAFESANRTERRLLKSLRSRDKRRQRSIVSRVREVYRRTGAMDAARNEVARSTRRALHAIEAMRPRRDITMLRWLAEQLLERNA